MNTNIWFSPSPSGESNGTSSHKNTHREDNGGIVAIGTLTIHRLERTDNRENTELEM